jgi:DNA segregation ATPase FtsK/SpoIIIE-like protein
LEFGKGILKLRTSQHFGLEAEEMLAEFTNLARAAGMFVILATQHPSKEVLTGLIMINFPTRVVLNSSVGGSMAALGTQSAFGLEYKGRAVLLERGQETKVQTPYISPETIRAVVHKAITGEDIKHARDVDLEEILASALKKHDGVLSITQLFSEYRDRKVALHWLEDKLRQAEGKEFIISGTTYRVKPKGNHTSRRLIRVEK